MWWFILVTRVFGWLQWLVVCCPGSPKSLFKWLLKWEHFYPRVARAGIRRHTWSAEEFRELLVGVPTPMREAVAKCTSLSRDCLTVLLHDSDSWVRMTAASNPLVDAAWLRELVPSFNDRVEVGAIVHNPNVTLDVLAQVALSDAGWVAVQVLNDMGDVEFAAKLVEIGQGELIGFPRAWALRVLA